jgi:hypothetical protein
MWARIKFTWQLWEYKLNTNMCVVLEQYVRSSRAIYANGQSKMTTQFRVHFVVRTQLPYEVQLLPSHFLSYFYILFWKSWWHYTTKVMAHITCLYFYDVAISPVEHHTNVTALAATQK